jgi:serine---pyruvate transaminase
VRPGDAILACAAGKFGERWIQLGEAYGAQIVRYEPGWGERLDPAEIDRRLTENPDVKVAFATLSETSTGIVHDIQAIADVARRHDVILAVDAVSGLGATELRQDEWGVDVVVAGSQKALMCPPGLAFVSVSDAAWGALGDSPRFYFDWEATRKAQHVFDAAFTPAVSLVRGLDVALGLILERGLEGAFEHHVRLGRAAREGIKAMGLELFSPDEDSAAVVTAVRVPEGVDGSELLLALRDRHGITLAPGQGALKGKIFRIGHIGYFDVFDIATALAALELALVELGAEVERGVAVTRAMEAYEQPVHA